MDGQERSGSAGADRSQPLTSPEMLVESRYFDAAMEEYRQLYETIRHQRQTSITRQTFFMTLSFGIIAYTIGQDISYFDLLSAALASIFLYFFAIYTSEAEVRHNFVCYKRLREIEATIGSNFAEAPMSYETNFSENWQDEVARANNNSSRFQHNPREWARNVLARVGDLGIQPYGFYLIILLWMFRLL